MIGIVRRKRQTVTPAARLTYTPRAMEPPKNMTAKYAEQATELEQLIFSIPSKLVVQRQEETQWSVLEIVCHLADAELLASARIRRIITQDRPNLWGYQQEQWATALNYRQRRIETVLARFALLRRENAELLESVDAQVWHQTGAHDVYGTLTLQQLIEDYLNHTAKHLDQIGRVAAEISQSDQRLKGIFMAKTQEETKEAKNVKKKEGKEPKEKDGKALMSRVKKVIKKSRRKLSEEKFEKELHRTIVFLEELQHRINPAPASEPALAFEPAQPAEKKSKDKSGNGKVKPKAKPKNKAKAKAAPGQQAEPTIISE
ncbi:MAG: DinB family protein [Acidobacteriota bacterium]